MTIVGPKRLARGYFLPSKRSKVTTTQALLDLIQFFDRNGHTIKTHRSDRGGEFLNEDYTKELMKHGICIQTTVRDTPKQNGITERINQTLEDRVHSIMGAGQLPPKLWD